MDERETAADRELSVQIRAGATRHGAPSATRAGIERRLRETETPGTPGKTGAKRPAPRFSGFRWWPVGIAFACGALASWLAIALLDLSGAASATQGEVLDAHVRSVLLARAVDVASSDQHTVKPWLSSRLDFSLPVRDLTADGFPLAGGRIDYISGRPVAALVYQRNKHWINVFVWPTTQPSFRPASVSRHGFNAVSWVRGGMQYWAVSDLGTAELATFGQTLQARIGDAS